MSVIYQSHHHRIGQSAKALGEQMLITFREGARRRISKILLNRHGENIRRAAAGARWWSQHCYPVTAVGSVAEQNLREQGISLCASMVCAKRRISRHRTRCGACTERYRAGLYFDVCRLRRKT